MRGSCNLWVAGVGGGEWGSGYHHERDHEQQEEERRAKPVAACHSLVRPIKGHVLWGHASRLTPALAPPPAARKPPVETDTGGAETYFWCACGVGLWITLRWGYEGVRRRGVVKLNYSWRYTFVFVRRKDYDDSLVVCHSWPRYPRATPTHVPRKIRAITNPRPHLPPGESWWGL